MNILLAYGYSQEAVPAYLEEALRREHRVVTCGPSNGRPQDIPCGPHASIFDVVAQLPAGFTPDVFIWVESSTVFLPSGVETLGIPTVCYQTAALWNHLWGGRYARHYDFVFVNSQRLSIFERAGCRRVYSLKNACDSTMRAEVRRERPIDVAFLGTVHPVLYPERGRYLQRLIALAERHGLNLFVANGLYRDKLHEIYQSSKMVFNSGFMGEGLNMRVFEAMVCGSLSLTNNGSHPGVSGYFTDGEDLILYDESRFEEQVLYYLRHSEERLAIAERGQEKVLSRHSYARPISEIFEVLEAHGFAAQPRTAIPEVEQLLDIACALYFNRCFDQAWQCLLAAEHLDAAHPEIPHAKAVLLAAVGNPNAEAAFQIALRGTGSLLTAVCYGQWLLHQGRYDEALRVVSDLPHNGLAWDERSWERTYYPHAWDHSRLDWLQIGMADHSGEDKAAFINRQRLSILMEAAIAQDRLADAHQFALALARVRPSDAVLWCKLGNLSVALERGDEAIHFYHRALAEDPFLLPARLGLVIQWAAPATSASPLRRACALLEENLQIGSLAVRLLMIPPNHPDLVRSWNELGKLRARLGQVAQAKEAWSRSLEVAPDQDEIQALLEGRLVVHPLDGLPETAPEAEGLPHERGFNIVVAGMAPKQLGEVLQVYLEAFEEADDVALHILTGPDLPAYQSAILDYLRALGRDPERIPDIALLELPSPDTGYSAFVQYADLVVGPKAVAELARRIGRPAFLAPSAEALRTAYEHFASLDWTPASSLSEGGGERLLLPRIAPGWEAQLEAFLNSAAAQEDLQLLIGVPPTEEEAWFQRIGAWMEAQGHDPVTCPDIELIRIPPDNEPAFYRQASAMLDAGNTLDRAIALALGLPVRPLSSSVD